MFSTLGPKPGLVCEISIPRDVGPAQPASFQSTARLPGLARDILTLRAVSPRNFEAATCSLARAPRLLWGVSLSTTGIGSSLSCPYTGLRITLVRRGLRSALIRHISSHDKMSRIVILLFMEKQTEMRAFRGSGQTLTDPTRENFGMSRPDPT